MTGTGLLPMAAALLAFAPGDHAQVGAAETFIPNVATNGIHDWQADGDGGLFIQSIDGDWYHARTQGRCGRLRTAVSLGFVTRGPDHLDRNGAVIAEGWRCQLASLTRSAPPEPRR